jgi:hypothetical protein
MLIGESACNSVWGVDGEETGETGAEGVLDAAQQGLWQQLWLRQQDFVVAAAPDADNAGYAARRKPSNNAIATLVNFGAMAVSRLNLLASLIKNGILAEKVNVIFSQPYTYDG